MLDALLAKRVVPAAMGKSPRSGGCSREATQSSIPSFFALATLLAQRRTWSAAGIASPSHFPARETTWPSSASLFVPWLLSGWATGGGWHPGCPLKAGALGNCLVCPSQHLVWHDQNLSLFHGITGFVGFLKRWGVPTVWRFSVGASVGASSPACLPGHLMGSEEVASMVQGVDWGLAFIFGF